MKSRQFSLGYLFLEVFWFGVALGLSVAVWNLSQMRARGVPFDNLQGITVATAATLAPIAWGTAIGGLFRRMKQGAVFGLLAVAFLVFVLFSHSL